MSSFLILLSLLPSSISAISLLYLYWQCCIITHPLFLTYTHLYFQNNNFTILIDQLNKELTDAKGKGAKSTISADAGNEWMEGANAVNQSNSKVSIINPKLPSL